MLKSNCSYAVATLLWVICYLWLAPTDVLAQTWRDADCLESVLDSGRWGKISVPSTGICRLTDAELRSMGFEQPENVRVYGYGGNLLSETFSGLPCADLPSTPMMRRRRRTAVLRPWGRSTGGAAPRASNTSPATRTTSPIGDITS